MRFRALLAVSLAVLAALSCDGQAFADPPRCFGCEERSKIESSAEAFTGTQIVRGPGGRAVPFGGGSGGSSCPGCRYDLVPACAVGDGGSLCPPELACADPADTRYLVYVMRPPAMAREPRGDVCLGPGEEPVETADITSAVAQYVDQLVPAAAGLRIQPPDGALVNLPTIFSAASGTEAVTQDFFPLGFSVSVTARPTTWTWTFDDGVTVTTDHPGVPYRGGEVETDPAYVTHTYRSAGQRVVRVVTSWSATYRLPGLGEVAVPGQVQRDSGPVTLPVREARSELIAGSG